MKMKLKLDESLLKNVELDNWYSLRFQKSLRFFESDFILSNLKFLVLLYIFEKKIH